MLAASTKSFEAPNLTSFRPHGVCLPPGALIGWDRSLQGPWIPWLICFSSLSLFYRMWDCQ